MKNRKAVSLIARLLAVAMVFQSSGLSVIAETDDSEETEINESQVSYKASYSGDLYVEVNAPVNAFDEQVTLVVEKIAEDSKAYAEAIDKMDPVNGESYTVLDIRFVNESGEEIEPDKDAGALQVSLKAENIAMEEEKTSGVTFEVKDSKGKTIRPSTTDTSTVDVYHITDEGQVEAVAEGEVNNGTVEATFEVTEFSTFVITDKNGQSVNTYNDLVSAVNNVKYGEEVTIIINADSNDTPIPLGNNAHYTINDKKNITLDLNGATLQTQTFNDEALFTVKDGGKLTIKDSSKSQTGTIKGAPKNNPAHAALIHVMVGSSLTLESGTIADHYNEITNHGQTGGRGGAILVEGTGQGWTWPAYKDPVTGEDKGGWPKTGTAEFKMTGGTISNCHAGGDSAASGFPDGSIVDKTYNYNEYDHVAGHGGGVFARWADVEISGGTITGCEAQYNGGGIAISNESTLKMTGGSILNNTSGAEGGGIALRYWKSSGTITGGTISNNTAKSNAVAYKDGSITNYKDWGGGGIFVAEESTLNMSNALIRNNSADGFGAGITSCPSGETYVESVDGFGLFDNTAKGVEIAGGASVKHADSDTLKAKTAGLFTQYNDYYSPTQETSISGTLLGGGDSNFTGTDKLGNTFTIKKGETKTFNAGIYHHDDASIQLAQQIGLNANPTDKDKKLAESVATLIIENNHSGTHGAGVLNNGRTYIGSTTPKTGTFKLTKTIAGDAPEADVKNVITFDVTGPNGNTVTFTLKDDFTKNGTVYELVIENAAVGEYKVKETAYTVTGYEVDVKYSVNGVASVNGLDSNKQPVEVKTGVALGDTTTVAYTDTYTGSKGNLKLIKTVSGYEGSDKTYKFQVKNSDGKYIDTDGTTSDNKVDITVTGGSYVQINNLTPGTYTVSEDETAAKRTNYSLVVSGGGNVTVKKGETAESTITNTYTKKSGTAVLKVTKAISGTSYTANEDFTFTLSDANDADKTGYKMPTTGLSQTAKDTETATFPAITFSEIGTYYFSIKETGGSTSGMSYDTAEKYAKVEVSENADGKTLDAVVTYGTDKKSCTASSLTVTNTYNKPTGKINIEKTFSGDLTDEEKRGGITFEVKSGTDVIGTYTIAKDFKKDATSGKYTKEIEVDANKTYTVTETIYNVTGYVAKVYDVTSKKTELTGNTKSQTTGTLAVNGTETVKFENNYTENKGYIIIEKTFSGDLTDEEKRGGLKFEVKSGNDVIGTYTIKNDFKKDATTGKYTKKLTVDADKTYTVTETNYTIPGYVSKVYNVTSTKTELTGTDKSVTTGTVSLGGTETVAFEDNYTENKGYIVIEKTFSGDLTEEEKMGGITFTVKSGTDTIGTYNIKDHFTEVSAGKYTKTLTVDADKTYTVTETNYTVSGYAVKVYNVTSTKTELTVDDKTVTTGKVALGKTETIAFEDNYAFERGNLEITKTIKGDVTPEEAAGALTFTITGPEYPNGKVIKLTDREVTKNNDGTYTIKLDNIKIGSYTVEETTKDVNDNDVTVKYSINNGTATTGNTATGAVVKKGETTEVDFENDYTSHKGNLEITKTIKGEVTPEEAAGILVFTITGPEYPNGKAIKLTDKEATKNADGTYTIKLDNIKVGEYTVEETTKSVTGTGVSVKYTINGTTTTGDKAEKVEVKKNETTEIDFENDYSKDKGTLKITKHVNGDVTETEAKNGITFDITTPDGTKKNYKLSEFTRTKGTNEYVLELSDTLTGTYKIEEVQCEFAGRVLTVKSKVGNEAEKSGKTVNATVKKNETLPVTIVNDYKKSHISISKVDIAGGAEVEGAKLEVLDKDKNVVDSWKSGDDRDGNNKIIPHEIYSLNVGEKYTLRETVAPEGYTVATDILFVLNPDGSITTTGKISNDRVLLIEDAKTSVKISKVDITDQKEIEGATLVVLDKDGNEAVKPWKSGDDKDKQGNIIPHVIEGLKTGVEYTLRETVAPEGYTIATDTKFTITPEGKVEVSGVAVTDNHILVEDSKTSVKISKVDITDQKEIEGATLVVLDKDGNEAVKPWKSGDDKDKQGNIIPHVIEGLKTGVEYTLRETVAPEGYTIATDTKFIIDEDGTVKVKGVAVTDNHILVEDSKTSVKISKVDITDQKEIEGAKLEVIEGRTTVESWKSGDDKDKQGNIIPHVIEGLKTGVEYTLRETVAPEGYTIATDTKFTIDEDGTVKVKGVAVTDNHILVEDSKTSVKISKVDITDQKELEGAKLEVIEGSTTVESWKSGDDKDKQGNIIPHVIEGLKTGVEYTLRETVAPEGYTIATDTKFTIDEDGTVKVKGVAVTDNHILVEDSKTSVKISKVDITDQKELEGAKLEVIEGSTTVESWKSGDDKDRQGNIIPHVIEGLKTGVEYTLRETVAPEGYTIATDTKFTITPEGKVEVSGVAVTDNHILVEDSKTSVKISKVDITDQKELEGAKLEVIEGSTTVESWKSGDDKDKQGNIIPHVIEGLKTGVEYTLRETVAPEGYTIATDTKFTITPEGKVEVSGVAVTDNHILVEDSKTSVKINKVDATGGKEVEGAYLEIIDKNGKTVESWKSGDDKDRQGNIIPHEVTGLKTNEEYTIRETIAPDGYAIATDTTFTIDENNRVTTTGTTTTDGVILIEDDTTKVTIRKTDITGTNEIEGAQLEIINKEGVIVESWTSIKDVSHDIIGKLIAGETYILRETLAPKGYEVANDITFTVGTDGKLQVVTMIDEYSDHNVAIKKTDIAGNEIVGATLTITDKDGNVVDGWTSNGTTHVSVLQPGTYTLTETRAPEGYEIAESITFTVDFDDNGDTVITIQGDKVTEVVMVDEDTPEDEDEHEDVPGREDDVSGNSGADTGDNSNLMLWLTVFFTSLVSGVTFFFVKKRRDEALN